MAPTQLSLVSPTTAPSTRPACTTEHVNALLGTPASLAEMGEALFRVNLTGQSPAYNLCPVNRMPDNHRLAMATMSRKLAQQNPIDVALRVAVLRADALPLR